MRAGRDEILAYRLAGHGLARRVGSPLAAVGGWSVQDSPPGAAALALHARVDALEPAAFEGALIDERTLVGVYNPRSAVSVVAAADHAAFTASFEPPDEEALRALLGSAIPDAGVEPGDAAELGTAAVSDALDGRVLSRDELHEELRHRLPSELLPWCRGCQSHHARRGLLNVASIRGALCLAGRKARQSAFARPDQWLGRQARRSAAPASAPAELVRRYLHAYGPSKAAHFAVWAGLSPPHARRSWKPVEDELVAVESDGRSRLWLLAEDAERLSDPPAIRGVRLLPPGDPLLQDRDRELLEPDAAVRKRIWQPLGAPGIVLADGKLVGLWRPRKQGKRLSVAVEPLAGLARATRAAVEAEAELVAPHRGCTSASVVYD